MPSLNTMRKAKFTVTITRDVANQIEEIVKIKKIPRSQVMEEILRDWLSNSKRKTTEKEIKDYYLSITEEEKKEDRQWSRLTIESAKRTWDD